MLERKKSWRVAAAVLLPAVFGVAAGVIYAPELRAAPVLNCYTWMYCDNGHWCLDADEYVGGCETDWTVCETPCNRG